MSSNLLIYKKIFVAIGIITTAVALFFVGNELLDSARFKTSLTDQLEGRIQRGPFHTEQYLRHEIEVQEREVLHDWILIAIISIFGIFGFSVEFLRKNDVGFNSLFLIGVALAVFLFLFFIPQSGIIAYTEEAKFALTTMLIGAGLISFLEMWRFGKVGVEKSLINSLNVYIALLVVIATFALCMIPASGHPPIPICVLTGPIGIILLLLWLVLAARIVRNRNKTVTSSFSPS